MIKVVSTRHLYSRSLSSWNKSKTKDARNKQSQNVCWRPTKPSKSDYSVLPRLTPAAVKQKPAHLHPRKNEEDRWRNQRDQRWGCSRLVSKWFCQSNTLCFTRSASTKHCKMYNDYLLISWFPNIDASAGQKNDTKTEQKGWHLRANGLPHCGVFDLRCFCCHWGKVLERVLGCSSAPQECSTRLSNKSVPKECPTTVFRKSVGHECPTKASCKMLQDCHTRLFHNSFMAVIANLAGNSWHPSITQSWRCGPWSPRLALLHAVSKAHRSPWGASGDFSDETDPSCPECIAFTSINQVLAVCQIRFERTFKFAVNSNDKS